MNDSFTPVSDSEWILEGVDETTKAELLENLDPRSLVDRLAEKVRQAAASQSNQRCIACYREPISKKTHTRSCVFIAIDDSRLFNQLFNGRCGYRAMYYHHPHTGLAYNQLIAARIVQVLGMGGDLSLTASTVKVWPFYELTYAQGLLAVQRWKGQMAAKSFARSSQPSF